MASRFIPPAVQASRAIAVLLLGLLCSTRGAVAADLEHGLDVFRQECAECHSAKAGKDKKGPSLFGVIGRPAAQVEGFAYSEALKQSKLTWNRETLQKYLAAPKALVPGGKMKYDGMSDAKDFAALLDYLSAQK